MSNSSVTFDITPEKEASQANFLYRQLFVCPPAISAREVDLKGKTAIVTGANIGLGFECSRQLLHLGLSQLILAVRDEAKGNAAREKLLLSTSSTREEAAKPDIQVWKMDLSSYESVTAFAERANTSLNRLDMVVLNAGVFKPNREINPRTQHEETVQVNYLSTALLAILLLPVLQAKNNNNNNNNNMPAQQQQQQQQQQQPGRLVIVSSETSSWAKFAERNARPLLKALDQDASSSSSFDAQDRYYTSKLLGQLFLTELTKRVPASVAVVNACNPGLCRGSGLHHETSGAVGVLFALFKGLIGRSTEVGARVLTDAAVRHGAEAHGLYIGDSKLKPMAPIIYKPEGERLAAALWQETMEELSFAGVPDIIKSLSAP